MKFYVLLFLYLLCISAVFFLQLHCIWFVILTALLLGLVAWGVSSIKLNLFVASVCKLKNTNNEIALTFDDGPDAELTPLILDLLAEYNAKATFFCIGNKIEPNKDLVKRIVAEGHSVGNHTFEHAYNFPIWSVKRILISIRKTDELIEKFSGAESLLFRPPFGITNNLIALAVKKTGKKSIGWSIRTKDTCRKPEEVIKIVERRISSGSIILLHDNNKNILTELKAILEICKNKNLKPIALS